MHSPPAAASFDAALDVAPLVQFDASDFELLKALGTVSYQTNVGASRTLSWSVSEEDAAPDTLAVTDAGVRVALATAFADDAPRVSAGETPPACTLFAGRSTGSALSVAPARVLLKAYSPAAFSLASTELRAAAALALRSSNGAANFWLLTDAPAWAEAPVAPVVGWFYAPLPATQPGGIMPAQEGIGLWVVQRWVTLTSLATLAATLPPPQVAQAAAITSSTKNTEQGDASTWLSSLLSRAVPDRTPPPSPPPPPSRAAVIVQACVGAVEAVAFLHSKRIAHGALDSRCFLIENAQGRGGAAGAAASRLVVRVANFGFAVVGSDDEAQSADEQQALADAAQRDCVALGVSIAEAVFGALSTEVRRIQRACDGRVLSLPHIYTTRCALCLQGPGPRTSGDAMRRLFIDIFARDWAAIQSYCADEPAWTAAVDALQPSGWALLQALLEVDTYSGDDSRVTAAASAWRAET